MIEPPSQWHHKLRTPKKDNIRRNATSWFNTTPANLREDSEHQYESEINDLSNGNGYGVSQHGKLPISYEVMRSFVAALAYIEKYNDQHNCSFFTTNDANSIPVVDIDSHKKIVEEAKQLILNDNTIAQVESFSKFNDVNVVSEGMKGAIQNCEPLIPESMQEHLFKIEKNSEKDIQKFLSQMNQNEVHMILLIEIFHHVSKEFKRQLVAESNKKDFLNQMAHDVGELVAPFNSEICTTKIIWKHLRRKKIRRRVMKTIIRYFAKETNRISIGSSDDKMRYEEEDSEVLDSSPNVSYTICSNDQLVLEGNSLHCNKYPQSTVIEEVAKGGVNEVKMDHFRKLDKSIESESMNPGRSKLLKQLLLVAGHTFESSYMDDIKKEAIFQMKSESEILNAAKRRLHAAELLLNHHEATNIRS